MSYTFKKIYNTEYIIQAEFKGKIYDKIVDIYLWMTYFSILRKSKFIIKLKY